MKKNLRILLCLLALVCLLCVSANAEEEPVITEQISVGILQEGGWPQSGPRPFASAQSADDPLDGVKAALKQGLLNMQASIDVEQYQLTVAEFKSVYRQVINENPELFFVSGGYGYSRTSSGIVISVLPKYKVDGNEKKELTEAEKEQINEQLAELKSVVDGVIAQVGSGWTELEKALFLHDYLATHAEYDMSYKKTDAYSLLVEGSGVCEAYTLAYRLLLNRVGITSGTVRSESLNHVWNLVQIDGSWYHVDVTWDDPVKDRLGRVAHTHFCTSGTKREELVKEAKKSESNWTFVQDWVYDVNAEDNDTSFDGHYWANVNSAFVPLGGRWYYLSFLSYGNSKLMQTDDPEKAGTQKESISAVWRSRTGSGYWPGLFSGLSRYQDVLIYNTPGTICSYNPSSDETKTLYTLTDGQRTVGDIYGSVMVGNELQYTLLENPNVARTQVYTLRLDPYESVPAGGYAYYLKDGVLYLKPLDTQQTGIVIAAWYGANGRMLGTKRMEAELSVSVPGAETVKIFAVAKIDYHPLCEATLISAR